MDVVVTVTSKGQITLPKVVRDALGVKQGDRLIFRVLKGRALLLKVPRFLDLAGVVPVPHAKRGVSWEGIKATTWRRRAAARRLPA